MRIEKANVENKLKQKFNKNEPSSVYPWTAPVSSSLALVGGNNQFIVIINTQGNPLFARENVVYLPKTLKILDYNVQKNYVELKELPEMPHFRCLQVGEWRHR